MKARLLLRGRWASPRLAGCLLGSAFLCISGSALADDDDAPAREDPWAYDRTKAAERKEREQHGSSELTFGWAGDWTLSAERLFGYARTGRRIDMPKPNKDIKQSVDRVHLLLNTDGSVQSFSAPRIAFDYFLADSWSLGLAIGYSSAGGDEHALEFSTTPRLGYAVMFGKVVGLWPRVGGTFQYQKFDGNRGYLIAGSFELPLVFVASQHSVLTLGPTADTTFYGKLNPVGPTKSRRYNQDELGISAGLTLVF